MRTERMLSDPAEQVVVVADIDGTLAFDGAPPGPAVRDVLNELLENSSVRVVLATARAPRGVRRLFGDVTSRLDQICCNGALVLDRVGGVTRRTLPSALVRRLVAELQSAGEPYCLDYGDHFRASSATALPWMGTVGRQVIGGGTQPVWEGVVKLAVASSDPWLSRFEHLAGRQAELTRHRRFGDFDVVAAGATKATALCGLLGPAHGVVVAVGNDENDRQILARSDVGVVVGDGLDGLDRFGHLERVAPDDVDVASALRGAVQAAFELAGQADAASAARASA